MKRTDTTGRVPDEIRSDDMAQIEQMAMEIDLEPQHARHVRDISLRMFDAMTGLHGLSRNERRLLEAAALLHDTGWSTAAKAHHKASRDIIMKMNLQGFKEDEKRMIACIARYHRKAHPSPTHKVYRVLDDTRKKVINKLAAILRLADGLDRSHCAITQDVRMDREGDLLRIHVKQRRPTKLDIWGAMRKRSLFEEVFRVEVAVLPDAGN